MLVACPGCRKKLSLPDEVAGRKAKCPECETVFAAPKLKPAREGSAGKPQKRKRRESQETYGLATSAPEPAVRPSIQPGIVAPQGPRLDRRRATFVDDEDDETDETGTSERADRPLRFFFERCVSDLREGGPWVMRLVSLVALAVLTDIVLWFTVGQSARMMPSGPARQLSATMQSDNLLLITLLIFNLLATPLQLALECVALGLALKTCSVIPPAKLDPLELVSDVMVTRLLGFCALFLLGLFVPVLMLLVLFGYPLLMYLFLPAWTTADRLEVSLSKSLAVSGMWFLYLIVSVIPMLLIAMADLLRLSTLAGLYVVLAAPFLILITAVVWMFFTYIQQTFGD